jgi:hypothetical protein
MTPRALSSALECSPSLLALLPAPDELALEWFEWYPSGPVTGGGCRTLDDVAATFANPEEAALNLSAWGWRETAYLSYGKAGASATRISIHRFATSAGAAQALDTFGSLANEPAGTSTVDPMDLDDHQRGLTEGYWAALVEQSGVLVIRVSFTLCCWPEGPGPIIQYPLDIMQQLHEFWATGDRATGPSPPGTSSFFLDPEADSAIAKHCLDHGDLACAKEAFEAAYVSVSDSTALSNLYDFYVVSGDMWQIQGDLDRARQDCGAAMRLNALWIPADERLSHLRDYAAVELFDPFTNFIQGNRGCGSPEQMVEAGMRVLRSAQVCDRRTMDWHLDVRLKTPGWEAVHWPHTPQSANYAVAAEVTSLGSSTAVGLNLAHDASTERFSFMVDPDTQEWWIEGQAGDGSRREVVPRMSYADHAQGFASRIEVRVINGTPSFFVNGVDLTTDVDLSWLAIPRTGNPGIVVASAPLHADTPPSATFKSFGIYALDLAEAPAEPDTNLRARLPELGDVPDGMVLTEKGGRGAAEIVATFPDPADAAERFVEWGWQGNAYRDFASPDGTTLVSVSLHRFADAQSASEALPYLADARREALGLESIAVGEVGDQAEAVGGAVAAGREASLYVRDGAVVARVTVVASTGDPLEIAVSTAMVVLRT